jgi:hypothetical protein
MMWKSKAVHGAGYPSSGGKIFRGRDDLVSRFQFVDDHRNAFEVKRLCEVLDVQCSSYYAWREAAPGRARRAGEDRVLADRIRVLNEADRALGAPRITAELNDGVPEGERVNHKKVARVMREHRIAGLRLRRKVRTTISDESGQNFPDLVKRRFWAPAPGCVYAGDITYLPIADGSNLYLATVIDLASRRLVGWAVADHMRTDLVIDALNNALNTRGSMRSHLSLRPRRSVHVERLRGTRQEAWSASVHGQGRLQRRQRRRGVLERHLQTRNPPRRTVLDRPGHLPPGRVPVLHPLQHTPQALLLRETLTQSVREDPERCYIHPGSLNPDPPTGLGSGFPGRS